MTKKIIIKNLILGFLSWLIPFAVSFLFYKPGGELVVPYATFKSTIMLVGIISGCYLLFRYFKFIESDYIKNAVIVGLSWFSINIILDTVILIPLMKTTFVDYFMSIGLSYFSIPTISITMGYLLNKKVS
ncbi:MAG: hypothetical protein JNK41_11650 [Saprospiraceae bacterium]|jgi:hypothetical protein|nr:hypothetical protein [Saprospiraceae bacterium]